MKLTRHVVAFVAASLLAGPFAANAYAEMKVLHVAQQFGISYLPLMLMEHQKLIEKHAKAMGLGDLKVDWSKFAGGNVMNEALLSGDLQFASGGVAPLIKIWAATKGNLNVKGVCAMNSMPLYLNTRNPKIKTIRDFTDKDKIALPAVKVSIQAVTLQMAAAKMFGFKHADALDKYTVTMSHPDGMQALLSGAGEIDAHFTSPPFQYQELDDKKVKVHTVLNSFDVLGGPATFNVIWTTSKFRAENPKLYKAFLEAFKEAVHIINANKHAAAEDYVKYAKSKLPVEEIYKMLADPQVQFTLTPKKTMEYADFLYKTHAIKVKPTSWKEMFFPEVHNLPGS